MDAALDLFSVNGFEATSISQIANAVGISKASLYFYFKSKQEILDTLVVSMADEYQIHSHMQPGRLPSNIQEVRDMVIGQIKFIVHDSYVSRIRKLGVIEQFRNSDLAMQLTKKSYIEVLDFHKAVMNELIRRGILQAMDPEIMAAQFAFPISTWISGIDRNPECEAEMLEMVERHINQFFAIYQAR